ncbi:MAG: twin-arginine translocation signal domain-containing protein, partial [Candidatus Methylomirabilales bacterium]
MAEQPTRRDFLKALGVTVGGTALGASAVPVVAPGKAEAQQKATGTIPDKPYKVGHMTFFTGAAAVLGEPMYKGHILAAEEINAQGGLLG